MTKLGVICVDDEKVVIESVENLCSIHFNEFIFEFALNAEEVYEIIDDFEYEGIEFALIISDYIMPGVKGDELLIDINEKYPDVKKIMLTGQSDINAVGNVINKANLYRYLTKPWENSDLILTINEALKSYKNEKEIKEYTKNLESKVAQRTKELEERTNELTKIIRVLDEHVMFLKMDFNGNLKDVSEAYANFLGYEKHELLNTNIVDKKIVCCENKMNEIVEYTRKNRVWKGELEILNKDLVPFWTDSTVTLIENEEEIGLSIIKHDISDKKKIEQLTIKDSMTNLYNRRFFNKIFPDEINRALRDQKSLSFVLFDIDKFKQYNDNYGHQAGDEALIKIGECMINICKRPADFPIRLGGEEFGIIFSGLDEDKSMQFAEQIRLQIENLKITHEFNTASNFLTASFGLINLIPDKETSVDRIYNSADKALYQAKQSGRNKVILGEY